MVVNTCINCGNELFIKKLLEQSYEYWCPNCLNLNFIDKSKSIEICKKYIELTVQKSLECCQRFSTEQLIYTSLNLREMATIRQPDVVNIKIQEIIWSTLILKDCLNNSSNGQEKFTKENLYKLFSIYRDRVIAENTLIEIQENYFYIFEDTPELANLVQNNPINIDGKSYRVVPSCKWRDFIESSETIQLVPSIRSEKIKKKIDAHINKRQINIKIEESKLKRTKGKSREKLQKKILQLKENSVKETMEILYNSFHATYYNEKFFKFSEIEREKRILDFIDLIRVISKEQLRRFQQNPYQTKNYYEMSLNEFETLCIKQSLDPIEMYSMLVSSKESCKEFPLLVEYKTKILVCPEMLLLISSFIRYGFDKEQYKSDLSFLGNYFAEDVAELFESQGFISEHPKHRGKKLVGIKINSINREFDVLPYNEKYLFVIECKRKSLNPQYIFNYEKENRAFGNDGIKDEIDNKHLTRVQYFQNNQKEFGFKTERIVKGLIVTLIKEEIENYKGVDIVPFFELKEYINEYIS